MLIMTEERADQIRKRNKAIEIRYSQSRRLSVMGREIEVCILLLPITGDLPKGTLLFKTATSATAGGRWGAVFNSRGLVEIEEILSHMPSKN